MKRNNHNPLLTIACYALFASVLYACNSSKRINRDYLYFRDGSDTVIIQQKETVIHSNDLLAIQVFSSTLNQEQASLFNVPASSKSQGYLVDMYGNIEMPYIGLIKVSGLTKDQLQRLLITKLANYVKDPSVLVRLQQFKINVLGEVKTPGTHLFQVDKVSIIDAISAAGDLTDYGRRENVTVIREENARRIYHTVDLRNRNLFESPVYMLQPNDIVYVSPDKNKLKKLSMNPDAQRRTGLILSITTVLLSIANIIIVRSR